jgi:phage gp46-like protein
MATDIAINWHNSEGGYGDFEFADNDLLVTSGIGDLGNAITISLFTDARCPASFTTWDGDRRGWWNDSYTTTPLGSQLWLLDRAKKTGELPLLLAARDYAKAALQWLLDDGIASAVDVRTSWQTSTMIRIDIVVTQPQQTAGKQYSYSWAWK